MGPIIESRFRQALGTANGDLTIFVQRPISMIMVGAMVILVGLAIWQAVRRKSIPKVVKEHGHF
jgi:putative tricarboxylic transport membrane protein